MQFVGVQPFVGVYAFRVGVKRLVENNAKGAGVLRI
jgi:hypothetical protein